MDLNNFIVSRKEKTVTLDGDRLIKHIIANTTIPNTNTSRDDLISTIREILKMGTLEKNYRNQNKWNQ